MIIYFSAAACLMTAGRTDSYQAEKVQDVNSNEVREEAGGTENKKPLHAR